MNPTPIQMAVVTASSMLAAVIGVLATVRRGHWLVTLLFSAAFLCVAAFQAGTLGFLHADGPSTTRTWATYMASTSALAAWLWLGLSTVLARPDPIRQVRQAVVYLALALVGCIALFYLAGTPYVISRVDGVAGGATIVLGGLGRVYLMYLVVVILAVLMNLESMLRSAPANEQERLRSLFLAFSIGILSQLLLVSAGLLNGRLQVSWMVLSAVPMFVAGVMTSLALARNRLSDMSVPVARPVVYFSSVSLTVAGLFLLTMLLLSRIVPLLPVQWQRGVSVAFYLGVAGGGLALLLDPRAKRWVRRVVDRNLYANRYDYRREWDRVSRAITPTARPEDICRQIQALLRAVFETDRVVLHLRDPVNDRLVFAHPADDPALEALLPQVADEDPLILELMRTRSPLMLQGSARDRQLETLRAGSAALIGALPAAVCVPLHVGEVLVGLMWLSDKRSREPYSFEDEEFLAAMAPQLAAALGFARLAEQLVETRQLESLHRLSSFVLHDIKNQVSGLSLVVENARRHLSDPEFQRDAMQVVERAVTNLRHLMTQVSGVGRPPVIQPTQARVRQVIEDGLAGAGLRPGDNAGVDLYLDAPEGDSFWLDPSLMARVLTNLLVNAREALAGRGGRIEIFAQVDGPADPGLRLLIRDDGPGMPEAFARASLFRPFATTKTGGLGIGLVQCRTIVEAHGGTIRVDNRPGHGVTFDIRLPSRSASVYAATGMPGEEANAG